MVCCVYYQFDPRHCVPQGLVLAGLRLPYEDVPPVEVPVLELEAVLGRGQGVGDLG